MEKTTTNLPPSASKVTEITVPLKLMDRAKYPRLSIMPILIFSYIKSLPKEIDEEGREFAVFPLKEAMRVFGCVQSTASTSITTLRKLGLLEVKQVGWGQSRRYYVKEEDDLEKQQ